MEDVEKEEVRAHRLMKKFFKTQIDAAKVLRQINSFIQDEQPKPLEYATPKQFRIEVAKACDLPNAQYLQELSAIDQDAFWDFTGKVRRMDKIIKEYEKEYDNVFRR